MSERQFDTLAFCREIYANITPSMAFSATTKAEAEEWQGQLRPKLVELLGGFPEEKCDLTPETVEVKEFAGYTQENVLFQSRENMTAFSYLLLPQNFKQPGPVIICLPGHGRGVDDIVGINEDGTLRPEWGGYQNDFALQSVANGFAALTLEPFGFGHRRDERARSGGAGASSCSPASGAAFLFGQTMAGWRVYDVIRAIDYLETRPEIDPKRIAVMGISGGGTITFFSAAVETRIKVAVISGYFNTFRDSIMSIPHCIDNYVPGILKYAEMYDIAGLIAPRAMFVESGEKDNIFPIEATKSSFEKAKKSFAVFGAEDKTDIEIFPKEHCFHGVKAFEFLKKQL